MRPDDDGARRDDDGGKKVDPRLKAFQETSATVLDRMYGTALRLTRNPADAEDLVQDALVRALEAVPRLDPKGNLAGYLFRTLTNLYINRYRRARVARTVDDQARVGGLDGASYSSESLRAWSDPATRFENAHLSAALQAGVDALPDRFREILILVDLMEWTYAEAAEALGIPVGTVMSRLFRARHAVRASVEAAWGGREPKVAVGGRS